MRNWQLAEEAVQEAFIAEWQANRDFADKEHMAKCFSLAVTNASNHTKQYYSAKKRQQGYVEGFASYVDTTAEAASELRYYERVLANKSVALSALLPKLLLEEQLSPVDRVNKLRLQRLLKEV